jgi:N-acetyltransferase 10
VANIARTAAGGGKAATIVSVKTAAAAGQKRKADDAHDREGSGKDKKATRRGGKKVKR